MSTEEMGILNTLSELLRKYIDEGVNNNRSYRLLSKKTGVSASTITRYAQTESKSKPDSGNCFAILKELTGSAEKAASLMKSSYPAWWDSMGKHLKDSDEFAIAAPSIDLTRDHVKVLYRSYLSDGVSLKWLKDTYGEVKGSEIINDLTNCDFLAYNESTKSYLAVNKRDSSLDRVLDQTIAMAKNIKHDGENHVEMVNRGFAACYFWANADKALFEEFKNKHDEFVNYVSEFSERCSLITTSKPYNIKIASIRDVEKVEEYQ